MSSWLHTIATLTVNNAVRKNAIATKSLTDSLGKLGNEFVGFKRHMQMVHPVIWHPVVSSNLPPLSRTDT